MASDDCRSSDRALIAVGALLGLLAVLAGTFAAHALDMSLDPKTIDTFQVAVRYQMYHALAIFCAAWLNSQRPGGGRGGRGSRGHRGNRGAGGLALKAGWLFVIGCVLFSGSLYALVLTGAKWLGMVAPIGGASFLIGWVFLGISALAPAKSEGQHQG